MPKRIEFLTDEDVQNLQIVFAVYIQEVNLRSIPLNIYLSELELALWHRAEEMTLQQGNTNIVALTSLKIYIMALVDSARVYYGTVVNK